MTGYEEWLRAVEAYRQAVTRYYEVYRYPAEPLPDSAQQVWCLPAGATEWEPVGYITDAVIGIDFGAPDPGESAVIAWPYKHGKTAALTVTLETPLTGGLRALYDALLVSHQADRDQRLRRLADDLGWWEDAVRSHFEAVQQVLEEAGVSDGYGRLTLPQPVRPPIIPPWPLPPALVWSRRV